MYFCHGVKLECVDLKNISQLRSELANTHQKLFPLPTLTSVRWARFLHFIQLKHECRLLSCGHAEKKRHGIRYSSTNIVFDKAQSLCYALHQELDPCCFMCYQLWYMENHSPTSHIPLICRVCY